VVSDTSEQHQSLAGCPDARVETQTASLVLNCFVTAAICGPDRTKHAHFGTNSIGLLNALLSHGRQPCCRGGAATTAVDHVSAVGQAAVLRAEWYCTTEFKLAALRGICADMQLACSMYSAVFYTTTVAAHAVLPTWLAKCAGVAGWTHSCRNQLKGPFYNVHLLLQQRSKRYSWV
jgi:hypothetical protein